jgi:hypothetical protein
MFSEYNKNMNSCRRNTLCLIGTGLMGGLAGCSSLTFGGKQEYAPVVLKNNHNTPHMMSVSVTSIPDEGLGFTEYFSDTWLVDTGGKHTFEEGIAFPDFGPKLMALVVLENETAKRADFSLSSDLTELRVLVTENGEIKVDSQNK